MSKPVVSVVIVDYKEDVSYLLEALRAIDLQTYRQFEVIVVHDLVVQNVELKSENNFQKRKNDRSWTSQDDEVVYLPYYPWLRVKGLGKKMGAANKRDLGVNMAKGDIIAFLDDDAYPSRHWLESLVRHYKNSRIAGVGGPGVTPPGVGFMEAASGWMNASPLGSGPYGYRFLPGVNMEVDDYPSMNLSVRKKDFLAVGGFDSQYWPGEDTKLCLDLVHTLGKKILYEPKALVYHHRRPLWRGHLRQNGNFGLHRGYFAKALPKTSLRLSYFLPSMMVLGIGYLVVSRVLVFLYVPYVYEIGLGLLATYLLALLLNSIWIWRRSGSIGHGLLAFLSVWVTQGWYGIRFLEGLFLKQKLVR